MGYASVTKGYKAGGYNSLQVGSLYAPEKVWNYEAGIKTGGAAIQPAVQRVDLPLPLLQPAVVGARSEHDRLGRTVLHRQHQQPGSDGLELKRSGNRSMRLRLNFTSAYIDARTPRAPRRPASTLPANRPASRIFSGTTGLAYTWHDVYNGDLEFDLQYAYTRPYPLQFGFTGTGHLSGYAVLQRRHIDPAHGCAAGLAYSRSEQLGRRLVRQQYLQQALCGQRGQRQHQRFGTPYATSHRRACGAWNSAPNSEPP
jgi:hypothetical protein